MGMACLKIHSKLLRSSAVSCLITLFPSPLTLGGTTTALVPVLVILDRFGFLTGSILTIQKERSRSLQNRFLNLLKVLAKKRSEEKKEKKKEKRKKRGKEKRERKEDVARFTGRKGPWDSNRA